MIKKFNEYVDIEDIIENIRFGFIYLEDNGFHIYVGTSNQIDDDTTDIYVSVRKIVSFGNTIFNTSEIEKIHNRILLYLSNTKRLARKNKVGKYHGIKSTTFSYIDPKSGYHVSNNFPKNKDIIELDITYMIKV